MPIKKKNTTRNKIILWALLGVIVVLMVISFSPVRHMTEIVLYP